MHVLQSLPIVDLVEEVHDEGGGGEEEQQYDQRSIDNYGTDPPHQRINGQVLPERYYIYMCKLSLPTSTFQLAISRH